MKNPVNLVVHRAVQHGVHDQVADALIMGISDAANLTVFRVVDSVVAYEMVNRPVTNEVDRVIERRPS